MGRAYTLKWIQMTSRGNFHISLHTHTQSPLFLRKPLGQFLCIPISLLFALIKRRGAQPYGRRLSLREQLVARSCNPPPRVDSTFSSIHLFHAVDLVSALLSVSQEAAFHPTQLFAAKLQILIPRPRPLIPFLRGRLIVSKCTVFEVDNAETVNCIIGAFRRASQPSCAAAASSAGRRTRGRTL